MLFRSCHDIAISDIADDQLGLLGKSFRPAALAMHLLDKIIENSNMVTAAEQLAGHRSSDEAGAAGDQYRLAQLLALSAPVASG